MVRRKRKQRKSSRRKRYTNDFGFGIDLPRIEIPKVEIPKIGYPSFEVPERKPINPNKLSKIQLVSILTKSVSSNQLYSALVKLGRHRLAEELKSELERINEKYRRMKAEVEGVSEEEALSHKILQMVVDEIIKKLKGIYTLSTKPLVEKEFQIQLEAFLGGAIRSLKSDIEKLGVRVDIKREFKLSQVHRRIDLMITVGGMRIGIEMKHSLDEAGEIQRLLGQIDEYSPFCDVLMVAVYKDVRPNVLREIKEKEKMVGKPIRIITPRKVW